MMHKMVLEFHEVFGALVSKVPQLPDHKTRAMRKKILEEEFDEYYAAVIADNGRDIVEMADALADISYVAAGTAVSYGVAPEVSFTYNESDYSGFEKVINDDYYVSKLKKSFADYAFAEALNDLPKISESLNKILLVVSETAHAYHIPLQAVFNEVHRSNMSKLDEHGKPIFREDGKILKSALYSPPDVKKVLADNWIVDGFTS